MVVIIDGLDCSGKSTVYEQLRQSMRGAYFLRDSYPGPSDQERVDRLSLFKRRCEEPYLYIYDRCTVVDDPVYEYMFNGRDSILEKDMDHKMFDRCLILHFTVSQEQWLERMRSRGDVYVGLDKYDQVYNSYKAFYDKYSPRVYEIDTTHLSKDEAYKMALGEINCFKEEF